MPGFPNGARRSERGLAAAGCDIQHALTGACTAEFDQPFIDCMRGAFKSRPPSFPTLRGIVPGGLLFVLQLQIVGILIAHRNFTFARQLRRATARPFAGIPFYMTRLRAARDSDRPGLTLRPLRLTCRREPRDRVYQRVDNIEALRSHTTE